MSERGSTVVIEVECRDAYEAIEMAEVLSKGMNGDGFVLRFGKAADDGDT